jgi:outer membrane protein TolC
MKYKNVLNVLTVTAALLPMTTQRAAYAQPAEVRRLNLNEAVHLALAQNRALRIARLKVSENQHRQSGARSSYFPSISNESHAMYLTNLQNIGIPAGMVGTVDGGLVPPRNVFIPQGNNTLYSSGTTFAQPLTQLIRIRQANRIAAAEVAVSRDDLKKAENQVALEVHRIYFGILIARLQKRAAEQQSGYAAQNLLESEEDVRDGSALKVAAIEGTAGVLESRQAVLTADLQIGDLSAELNDLLGLSSDTRLELDPVTPAVFDVRPREEYVRAAWSENPEIQTAEDTVRKAKAGVTEAKSKYLPDITAFAHQSYQDGVPFLVRNFGTFGVNLNWEVFDFGKRRSAVREREDQLAQAEENVRRLKDQVAVTIERSYNKLQRIKSLVEVADQLVKLREANERLAENQLAHGVVLVSDNRKATAATYKAQADLLQSRLSYLLAWAELEQAAGQTPGF